MMGEQLQGRLARLDQVLEDAFESHGWQAFRMAEEEALRATETTSGSFPAFAPVPNWVAELLDRIDVLSRRVAATEETFAGAFDAVRSDGCPTWASTLLLSVEGVAGRLEALESLAESLAASRGEEPDADARPAWADTLTARIEGLGRRLSAAETTAASVADAVVLLREDVRRLGAELGGRVAQVAATSEELRTALVGP